MPAATEPNLIRLTGQIDHIRRRFAPDGSLAVLASLIIPRPSLGAARAGHMPEQPVPLRALGAKAEQLLKLQHQMVEIKGCLRRRYYNRGGETSWGQVEIWVENCIPVSDEEI